MALHVQNLDGVARKMVEIYVDQGKLPNEVAVHIVVQNKEAMTMEEFQLLPYDVRREIAGQRWIANTNHLPYIDHLHPKKIIISSDKHRELQTLYPLFTLYSICIEQLLTKFLFVYYRPFRH